MEERRTKVALIQAGIREIRKNGLNSMSMRRIAAECNISCATPYKHFRNRDEFILEIFSYIHQQWNALQADILSKYSDPRERIVEICIAYVRFLGENSDFRSILFLQDESLSREQLLAKSEISDCSKYLVETYCQNVQMSAEDRWRKTYIVRSMLYGAAFLLSSGELEENEHTYEMIRAMINREFELS